MQIRNYRPADKTACLDIFDSNAPKYFAANERALFVQFLDSLASGIPVYADAEQNHYYVIHGPEERLAGCGGFYKVKGANEARFAWGMIHHLYHRQGYGTALCIYRKDRINELWAGVKITLGTSQHTHGFFEKMGFKNISILPGGYGPDLDRHDMSLE